MHPNRQVIYEATIRRMVTEALNEKEERFAVEHSSDTDAQLVMYLRQCAAGLGYTPHAKEIVGWQYLLVAGIPYGDLCRRSGYVGSPCDNPKG